MSRWTRLTDPTSPRDENTAALYSLFCGVLGVVTAFFYIGALFGVIAVVLGRQGLIQAYQGRGRRSWAILGLMFGMIAILVVIAWLIDQATG
jgi:hypothetical protein